MSLHSSYKDFRDYQISNVYFDSLKKTPPSRLHYFFRPELDYDGYINVVRDQEEIQYKKQVHSQNLALNRQELRRKNCKRMIAREMLEKQLGMPHARAQSSLEQFANSMGLTNGEELHSSVRETMKRNKDEAMGNQKQSLSAHKRWEVARKNLLDKRAIGMIENRMQQEAHELQLMEGWRAAARNSIRDKFVDTRHRNTVVERHMDFLHTRDRLAPSAHTTQQLGEHYYEEGDGRLSPELDEMLPSSQQSDHDGPRSPSAMSAPEEGMARSQQPPNAGTMRSRSTLPQLRSTSSTPLPDIKLSQGEVEEQQYVLDSLDEIDDFSTSIGDRQVKPNQRLRSLAIDSTKSWTRPMPR